MEPSQIENDNNSSSDSYDYDEEMDAVADLVVKDVSNVISMDDKNKAKSNDKQRISV